VLVAQAAAPGAAPGAAQDAGSAVDAAWRSLDGLVDGMVSRLPHLAVGVVVALLFWLTGRLVRRLAHTAGQRTRLDPQLADVFGSLAIATLTLLGVLVAAVVVFPTFRPGDLVKGLGITSVAVGFAFKDVLQNFFAGVLILLRKPFVVGDQIRVKEWEGSVEEITTRSTRLKTYDGERVVIPNGDVYTSSVLVRTHYPTRRVKFTVGIGYPDDIERARGTILEVVRAVDGVHDDPAPQAYVEELAPSSVNFTVYFWTASQQANVLRVRDGVATAIKQALDRAGIDMPFPHTVLLFHDQTGARPGDRPAATASGRPPASGAPNGVPEDPADARADGRR
jgi:small-conductance mechanosensitive channel